MTQRNPNTVPRSRYARSDAQRRSDTQPRIDSHHQDPQANALDPRSDVHHLDPRVGAHHFDPHAGAYHFDSHVGARRSEPRSGSRRLEPRVDSFRLESTTDSYRMEPRVATRRLHDTGRNFGRGSRSDHSPPPSPTPLPRTFPPQPPAPPVQALNTSTVTRSHSIPQTFHNIPQAQTRETVTGVSDHSDLGDVFDLDLSYVQLRDAGCVRAIHTPPRGQRGPKGRWYVVCVGREVGVFNDWYVHTRDISPYRCN